MLSVRVKRAVLKPRTSLPISGMRSCSRWKRRFGPGLASQRDSTMKPTMAMISR